MLKYPKPNTLFPMSSMIMMCYIVWRVGTSGMAINILDELVSDS
jgi:hypothetical protein